MRQELSTKQILIIQMKTKWELKDHQITNLKLQRQVVKKLRILELQLQKKFQFQSLTKAK